MFHSLSILTAYDYFIAISEKYRIRTIDVENLSSINSPLPLIEVGISVQLFAILFNYDIVYCVIVR